MENPLLYEDLDGDGVSDFIFGDTTDNGDTGKVFWVSGTQTADFSVLDSSAFMWTGAGEDDEFGKSILVVEDQTNDGVASYRWGSGARTVYLFDGSTVIQRMLFGLGRFLPLVVQNSEEYSQTSVISMGMGPLSFW